MKIASTDLDMQSSHADIMRQESSETLRSWRGARPDFEAMESAITRFSDAARQLLARSPSQTFAPVDAGMPSGEAQAIEAAHDVVDNDPFLAMIRQMIQFLTGEEVKVLDMREFSSAMRRVEVQAGATQESLQASGSGRNGWGVEYDYHALREEFEQTSFSASGIIRTTDGQEFSFQLDIEMTRYFRQETNVSVRAGDAVRKDPLVVNFGGTAAQLAHFSGQRFLFDLDGDGQADLLPLFASGSGYLALDRNENGRIDSGQELFGPATGHGFGELAQLDSDGNGWIDEGDPAFAQLAVWTPDAAGKGELSSLAELGIDALGLANLASPFALRGSGNEDLGFVKASGLYLAEDGKAGSLQEIDLTV